jgi:hypothetical protein
LPVEVRYFRKKNCKLSQVVARDVIEPGFLAGLAEQLER